MKTPHFKTWHMVLAGVIALVSVLVLYVDVDRDNQNWIDGDCRPFNREIYEGKIEISFDGIDQNCDKKDFIESDTADNDGDGYSKFDGDCDDFKEQISPEADEIEDGIDNDCDGHVDEQIFEYKIIDNPTIPRVGANKGYTDAKFLREISASQISVSGTILGGTLLVEATTKSPIASSGESRSVAIKMYIGTGDEIRYSELEERYLDANWVGNGNNFLDSNNAGEKGGVFFAGQVRELKLNIRSLPVAARSFDSNQKESINLIELLEKHNDLFIGFYTSAPGFGQINNAILRLEIPKETPVITRKLGQ